MDQLLAWALPEQAEPVPGSGGLFEQLKTSILQDPCWSKFLRLQLLVLLLERLQASLGILSLQSICGISTLQGWNITAVGE